MKQKENRYTGYYQFMEEFFEKGNEEQIQRAKREYRRQYKAKWRRENRRIKKEIVSTWDKHEYRELKTEATKHKLPLALFIKRAVIGYINTRYFPVHQKEVTQILKWVTLTTNIIEELHEENVLPGNISDKVIKAIAELEHHIRIALFSPKTIWQILSIVLTETPTLQSELITYIQNFVP